MLTLDKPNTNVFKAPVLIICYNRVQYIETQISALRKVKPVNIFIASDGPKNTNDQRRVEDVRRRYLELIDWECNIKTLFQDNNLGCFQGVKSALSWFFSINKEGIIIEDDIIPNSDFFYFMEVMLNHYRNDNSIFCISGCNLGYSTKDDIFLSKIMNMWGWATWSDRYREVDFSINSWSKINNKKLFLYNRLKSHLFDIDLGWIEYWDNIFSKAVNNEKFSTWDYQLIYNQLYSKSNAIFPGKNLVNNLGFDSDATHTQDDKHVARKLRVYQLDWPLTITSKVKHNVFFYENFIKNKWAYYTRPNWKYFLGQCLKKLILKR